MIYLIKKRMLHGVMYRIQGGWTGDRDRAQRWFNLTAASTVASVEGGRIVRLLPKSATKSATKSERESPASDEWWVVDHGGMYLASNNGFTVRPDAALCWTSYEEAQKAANERGGRPVLLRLKPRKTNDHLLEALKGARETLTRLKRMFKDSQDACTHPSDERITAKTVRSRTIITYCRLCRKIFRK